MDPEMLQQLLAAFQGGQQIRPYSAGGAGWANSNNAQPYNVGGQWMQGPPVNQAGNLASLLPFLSVFGGMPQQPQPAPMTPPAPMPTAPSMIPSAPMGPAPQVSQWSSQGPAPMAPRLPFSPIRNEGYQQAPVAPMPVTNQYTAQNRTRGMSGGPVVNPFRSQPMASPMGPGGGMSVPGSPIADMQQRLSRLGMPAPGMIRDDWSGSWNRPAGVPYGGFPT